jgi:hypothetical protein
VQIQNMKEKNKQCNNDIIFIMYKKLYLTLIPRNCDGRWPLDTRTDAEPD